MTRDERLGFLWLCSVAARHKSGAITHNISTIEREPLPDLAASEISWDATAQEARDIGKAIAKDGGMTAMIEMLDEVEGLWGLNSGEWLARRWEGIEIPGGGTWNA